MSLFDCRNEANAKFRLFSKIAVASLLSLGTYPAAMAQSPPENETREEIYVAKALRVTRVNPTEYCKRAGDDFEATAEDTYDFFSIALSDSDGRATNTNVRKIGDLRACFGRSPTSDMIKFFSEGKLNDKNFKGNGACMVMKSISPAEGITPSRCHLELTNFSSEYIGGLLTSNAINTKAMTGEVSDPPGYTITSIFTVRLWRK